jgi:ferrous iron transport protein B
MKETVKVALVGNPNCGKSSLFNALTGLRQKVGNFAGVTVDKKTGFVSIGKNRQAEIVDLPGTYSIYPKRVDEYIVFDVLINNQNESHPDVIIIVADAANLKRNLLFCSQIIDLQKPTIIALNMLDVAKKNGTEINIPELSKQLGVKVVPINARSGKGTDEIKTAIAAHLNDISPEFSKVRDIAPEVVTEIKSEASASSDYAAFLIASHYINVFCLDAVQKRKTKEILEKYKFNPARLQGEEILRRYGRINQIIEKSVVQTKPKRVEPLERANRIDKMLTHPVIGYLIFLVIMFVVFQAVFSWAQYPMLWISSGFKLLHDSLASVLPVNFFTRLLLEGVISGLSGIAVFIPQIMILFGFISILEDTGYLARVSFILDKLMRKVGLSGKSVVPLMSGMACAIPAIMSTRNIENWKDRITTIMVTPLMSCSARLPVYTLLVGMIVPDHKYLHFLNLKGLTMMGLYLFGFVMAILSALIMKFIIRSKERSYYMMELPIYRMPRWKSVFTTMVEKARVFVWDAGKIIIVISIILWFLASFGPGDSMQQVKDKYANTAVTQNMTKTQIDQSQQSDLLLNSYAGRLGHFIEPVIQPLGFDWKIGICLITSFAAREVFVGTMSTIYNVGSHEEVDYQQLKGRMLKEINPKTGKPLYSVATAFSLMIFFALAMQCMSTIAIVKRETKSWKWPLIQLSYMTGLAYVFSLVIYQSFK